MKFTRYVAATVSVLFIPFAAPSVLAQTESSADVALEEIVVHGRKREESLLEVPVSISVFDAEALAARGIVSQQDLFDATPSLSFDIMVMDLADLEIIILLHTRC